VNITSREYPVERGCCLLYSHTPAGFLDLVLSRQTRYCLHQRARHISIDVDARQIYMALHHRAHQIVLRIQYGVHLLGKWPEKQENRTISRYYWLAVFFSVVYVLWLSRRSTDRVIVLNVPQANLVQCS
jgi:hypothetical protein